jgi:hypothetical protein
VNRGLNLPFYRVSGKGRHADDLKSGLVITATTFLVRIGAMPCDARSAVAKAARALPAP